MAKLSKREQLRKLPASPALQATFRVAREGQHVQEGRLQSIPTASVVPDPEQPRTRLAALGITAETVRDHVAGKTDLTKGPGARKEAIEALQELATSIEEHGLIQPITVYPDGNGFAIGSGERRFLAHLLLQRAEIRAMVRPRPDSRKRVFAQQLTENLARENLSLAERIDGLRKLDALHREEGGDGEAGLTPQQIAPLIGVSVRQAYKYLAVMGGPESVMAAIQSGAITGLNQAADIAGIKNPDEQQAALQRVLSGEGATPPPAPAVPPKASGGRGRPTTKVALGATTEPAVVAALARSYLGEQRFESLFKGVDWADLKAVAKAWAGFVKAVEETERRRG